MFLLLNACVFCYGCFFHTCENYRIYVYIYIYIYIYIYGIHHRTILWSSYRKLARVGFEPTTTEFRSDALTDWAIRPWVQLALRANFVQLLQFHRLFSVTIHFGYCLRQSPHLFWLKFCWGNHMSVAEWVDTYVIHHRSILWSSYRKLPRVGFEPTTTELRSDALTNWAIRPRVQLPLRANFAQPLQSHRLLNVAFHFGHCLRQSPRLFQSKFCWGNHMSVAEYIYKYI